MLIGEELDAAFAADLAKSGLTPVDVPAWNPMDGREAKKYGPGHMQDRAGYVIPYFNMDGSPLMCTGDISRAFVRYRFLETDSKGHDNRYWSPDDMVDPLRGSHVYIPRGFEKVLRESEQPFMIITEGEKKAEAGCKAGIPTVAIPGVEMWRDPVRRDRIVGRMVNQYGGTQADAILDMKEQKKMPVAPELLAVIRFAAEIRRKLVVGVLFDSDGGAIDKHLLKDIEKGDVCLPEGAHIGYWTHPTLNVTKATLNPRVAGAGWTLAQGLREHLNLDLPVQTVFCPIRVGSDSTILKIGLDDWIVADGGGVLFAVRDLLSNGRLMSRLIDKHLLFGATADPDCLRGGESKVTPEVIFEDLLDAKNVGRAPDVPGELFRWTGASWVILEQQDIRDAAHIFLDMCARNKATAHTETSCVVYVPSSSKLYEMPDLRVTDAVNAGIRIAMEDRTVEIDANGNMQDVEPNRKHGLRHHITAQWADRNQPTPMFDAFINRIQPDRDVQKALIEYMGYTFFPDCRFEVAQFWIGKGANGKSALANILHALHSKMVTVDLSNLRQFHTHKIIGASLVSVDETPPRFDEQMLKALISGSDVDADRKHRSAITARPTAKWIIRGNEPPAISDHSDGFWRRQQVIRFDVQIPLEERDELLAQKIIQQELAGVMYRLLKAAAELFARGKMLPDSVAMQAAKAELRRETSSVLAWITELEIRIEGDKEWFPKMQTVYAGYSSWCKENGFLAVSSTKFWRQVEGAIKGAARDRVMISGMRHYVYNVQSDARKFPGAASDVNFDAVDSPGGSGADLKDNPFMH